MRLSAGNANTCGWGSPGLANSTDMANSTEGICPTEEGQGLVGMVLQTGKSATGGESHSKGYWPTLGGMHANHDEIIQCQALGVLTHSHITLSMMKEFLISPFWGNEAQRG